MRRHIHLLAAIVAVGLLGALQSQAGARADQLHDEEQYAYFAEPVGSTWIGVGPLEDGGTVRTPAGAVAIFGYTIVTPTADTLTIEVNDFAALDGQAIALSVHPWGGGRGFSGCVPVRSPVDIPGVKPGRPVWVSVYSAVIDGGPACSAGATAGLMTIRGATPV